MSTITLPLNMSAKDLSHELRIPLTGILGGVALLDDEPLSMKQKEQLNLIKQSGDRLLAIINTLLTNSKEQDQEVQNENLSMLKNNLQKLIFITA